MNLTENYMLALLRWSEKRRPGTMIENIITLIIAEAQGVNALPLPSALRQVMLDISTVIDSKVNDIAAVTKMEIPEDEKERITELILQASSD